MRIVAAFLAVGLLAPIRADASSLITLPDDDDYPSIIAPHASFSFPSVAFVMPTEPIAISSVITMGEPALEGRSRHPTASHRSSTGSTAQWSFAGVSSATHSCGQCPRSLRLPPRRRIRQVRPPRNRSPTRRQRPLMGSPPQSQPPNDRLDGPSRRQPATSYPAILEKSATSPVAARMRASSARRLPLIS